MVSEFYLNKNVYGEKFHPRTRNRFSCVSGLETFGHVSDFQLTTLTESFRMVPVLKLLSSALERRRALESEKAI